MTTETEAPKAIATLDANELHKLTSLRVRITAINAMAETMVNAILKASGEERRVVMEEEQVLWKDVLERLGLAKDKCYDLNKMTGEIYEHDHTKDVHPLAALFKGMHVVTGPGPDPDDETTKAEEKTEIKLH